MNRSSIHRWANNAVNIMNSCTNEAQVTQFLVLPFFEHLGYDSKLPDKLIPQAKVPTGGHVDYLVTQNGEPAIVVECKPLGAKLVDEIGQLRRYYNGFHTAKIGILTNGIVYKFFCDSDNATEMDSVPFATLDLKSISQKGMSETTLTILECLSDDSYKLDSIYEIAHMRLVESRLKTWWNEQFNDPSDELCRLALRSQGVNNLSKKKLTAYKPLITSAFVSGLSQTIWKRAKRIGISTIIDPNRETPDVDPRIVTTQRELDVFQYCRTKIAQHSGVTVRHDHFGLIDKKDYVEKFVIFYKRVNSGRLMDFYEANSGPEKFVFPCGTVVYDLNQIDAPLLNAFQERVAALNR